MFINKIIGAIFCQVKTNRQLNQANPSITSGNQKWNGAVPILINNAEFIVLRNIDSIEGAMESVLNIVEIIENKKIIEAIAWARKYFIDASDE